MQLFPCRNKVVAFVMVDWLLMAQNFGVGPLLLFLGEESHSVYTAPHLVLPDCITICVS